jgi:DNA (cytosine-5)-methyltransferase 1
VVTGGFFDRPAHSLRADGFDASEDGTGRGTPLIVSEVMPTMRAASTGAAHNQRSGDTRDEYIVPVAFSCKDSGLDSGELSPTLRSMNFDQSHANADGQVAVAFQSKQSSTAKYPSFDENAPSLDVAKAGGMAVTFNLRGREGGSQPELADQASLRAASGGSSRSYVATGFQSSQSGIREVDTHATLDSNNGSRRHNGVTQGMQVRRLTPRECERLQGFPDDYTLIPNLRQRKNTKRFDPRLTSFLKDAADGPRYKALGNSMAVPCMTWIGKRLQLVDLFS